MTPTVTALVVSHDGTRWLPAVLDALAAQTRPPDAVVAVDTGSVDASAELLRARLGEAAVQQAPATSSYAEAVGRALATLPPAQAGDWVWLLHDDSAPAPEALEHLLGAVRADPGIAAAGPKLREWPSLRRLLELGVTVSGTGRRETGLERGEYDQGQHDRKRDVLAVNTAGMLVRRDVLEQIGFDRRLPVFGPDLDFGWRLARAGHRTVVVPDAVVFHAEAASRGLRTSARTGRPARSARAAALYVLLVNGSALGLPWRALRLLGGSLLRALGFLLVRAPREAYDEIAAVGSTYLRPHRVAAGRLARRRTATVPHREVRPLLAPTWLPYRHGLDFVADIAAAVVHQAGDVSAARRARTLDSGPVDDETEVLAEDTGVVARVLTSRVGWVFAALVVLALLGTRGLLGAGLLSGGALLPAPDSAAHWWSTAFAGWHRLGVGSAAPAAPYLLPLALAGSVLLGKAWLVVDLLLFGAVPLAAWGAFRFLRRVSGSESASLWGAVTYALFPVLSGSVPQGRLGSVAAAVVLPYLAHSALFLSAETADRRWRACFRTGLWLGLLACFVPLALPLVGLLLLAVPAALAGTSRPSGRLGAFWLPTAVAIVVAAVLLTPWAVLTWSHAGPESWLLEAGRAASPLVGRLGPLDLLAGRAGDVGAAPAWLAAGSVLAAVVALARADTRARVLAAWLVVLVGLGAAALLAGVRVQPATAARAERVWLGFPLLLVQAGALTGATLAGAGIRQRLAGSTFGWRQPLGLAVTVAALSTPLLGLGWWAVHGSGAGGVLDRGPVSSVPAYMSDDAAAGAGGVLVVRGSGRRGFAYLLLHQRGLRLGDDSVLPTVRASRPLTGLVGDLASAPTGATARGLGERGVRHVYAPAPVDVTLAGNLDSLAGVAPASALAKGARAWTLDGGSGTAPERPDRLRPWWSAAVLFAAAVAAVLAAPTRRRGGR